MSGIAPCAPCGGRCFSLSTSPRSPARSSCAVRVSVYYSVRSFHRTGARAIVLLILYCGRTPGSCPLWGDYE